MSLALRFYSVAVSLETTVHHEKLGGRNLQMFKAQLSEHAQELRMMVGKEPAGPKRELIVHLSLSVGLCGHKGAYRAPTDEECDAAKSLLSLIQFREDSDEATPCIRHFWEVLSCSK